MRIERYIWLFVGLILSVACGMLLTQKSSLEHAFLADERYSPIKLDAIRRFKKEQDVNDEKIDKMFYISFGYFDNKVCIRFIPRPQVYGGVTSYCYQSRDNIRLITSDHSG